jgi:hypothetical protein
MSDSVDDDNDNNQTTSAPNPTTGLIWFMVITSVYMGILYFMGSRKNKTAEAIQNLATQNRIFGGVYILLLIVGEYFINLNLTNAICGTNQWSTALLVTILPWVVIFGVLNLILLILPGWLSPFSNTFGYGIAKLAGLKGLMDKIFKSQMNLGKITEENNEGGIQKALAQIYTNQSLLINEITPDNFDKFWTEMSPLFNRGALDYKEDLRDIVRLKDIVAQFIWYMLTGGLVTSVGYNYIVNSACSLSSAEMKKRHDEYVEKEQKIADTKKSNPIRVYSTNE